MRIIVAPDSFKGSISTFEFIDVANKAIKEIDNNIEIINMPLSDGGENVLEVLKSKLNGICKTYKTYNAYMEEIEATVLFVNRSCYIESAKVIGLTLVNKFDIRNATSYGLGYLIKQIKDECDIVNIFLGGTATNDAGMGMLEFVNDIKGLKYNVYSDVTNPLLGDNGATKVFSKQKGANDLDIDYLENKLTIFANKYPKHIETKGAGAAGGLGYFFLTYLNANIFSGIKFVLSMYDFYNTKADLIITGEGKFDSQSLGGKVISELLKSNIKVLVFSGIVESDYPYAYQISDIIDYGKTKENLYNKIKEVLIKEL